MLQLPVSSASAPSATHLRLWLGAFGRVLDAALDVQASRVTELASHQVAANAITPDHARFLAGQGAALLRSGHAALPALRLNPDELAAERVLIEENPGLPLSVLGESLEPYEIAALLICTAAAISPTHERLFAYLVDDLSRAHASLELLLLLTSGEPVPEFVRRRAYGADGHLVRSGVLTIESPALGARAVLRPGPAVVDWLSGCVRSAPLRLHDPDLVVDPQPFSMLSGEDSDLAARMLCEAGGVVGVWGQGDRAAVSEGLAQLAGRPLRHLRLRNGPLVEEIVETAFARAAADDAIVWLELDSSPAETQSELGHLASLLAGRIQPLLISAREPWRPPVLLCSGCYTEVIARDVDSSAAAALLAERADIDFSKACELTGRYRFTDTQQRIVAALALQHDIESASRMAAASVANPFVNLVEPRRGPDDLILPPSLHAQVLEIASFFIAAPAVDERWGFGRLSAAPGSLKVLFTGDPGTGKTLSAEIVAKLLGRQLLKVDIAQVTSKWIGETEKNLQAVFDIAEQTAAVLFFDEAECLFGKRGEIRHGTDRYANLEVGFLLQRLETYRGLVILSSNLRDEIDPAFTRRFQMMLHFPRPAEAERRRLWELALADVQGVATSLDWDALVRLDLTGAAIVSCARLASLIACTRGDGEIDVEHIDEAIARQYRQEARLWRGRSVGQIASAAQ